MRMTTKDISYSAIGAALIAICSWISIPAGIPFTMQTFAVCLITALLGIKNGIWSVCIYIFMGIVGVPVFSGFRGGIDVILGTTGGYIAGFIFTAVIVGLCVGKFGKKLHVMIISMTAGILVCYAFGTAWFVIVYTKTSGAIGIMTALSWCVFPYLIPDAVKIILASVLTLRLDKIIRLG